MEPSILHNNQRESTTATAALRDLPTDQKTMAELCATFYKDHVSIKMETTNTFL